MKLLFLGNEDECLGFALAGVETCRIGNANQFDEKMEELLNLDNVGVIVVADRFFDRYFEKFSKSMQKRAVPAVVFVPSFDGRHATTDIKGYLSGVLGIRL